MKTYKDEKIQSLQRMILFVEIFANVKRFGVQTNRGRLLYETKKMRKL